jgi:hypothetical protein
MDNATHDTDNRPKNDAFRYERPGWMSDDDWATIVARTTRSIDVKIVEEFGVKISRPCTERDWCTVTDPVEHDEFHASAVVDLILGDTENDTSPDAGWWCWLVENRDGSRLAVSVEGYDDAGTHHDVQLDVVDASALLAATRTRDSHNALLALIRRATA